MVNEVHVLFDGYSFEDPNETDVMRANCSCTVVKGKDNFNVIIDTMTPWDKDRIIEGLSTINLSPDDIRTVVNTHGHSDHTGNNNLFPNIEWLIVGECVSIRDKYISHNFKNPFKLTDDIYVIKTPGHTLSCVSVIVEKSNLGRTIGVCGDLFEKEDDISDCSIWLSAGSEDPDQQRSNRAKIADIVDFIIPGHGKGFSVNEKIRSSLKSELN